MKKFGQNLFNHDFWFGVLLTQGQPIWTAFRMLFQGFPRGEISDKSHVWDSPLDHIWCAEKNTKILNTTCDIVHARYMVMWGIREKIIQNAVQTP